MKDFKLKKNFKVSVLIANYNNQNFINKCIKSLKSQSYKNLEIIFHDDCSKDKSLIIASRYKNIKIIKNKIRGKYGSINQMRAYERAFKISKGEIIFFLDSDDYFTKRKIEKIVKLFKSNHKLNAVYDLPIHKYGNNYLIKKNKKKFLNNYWPYIPPQSCISIRRNYFKKIMKKINFKKFPDIWMDFRIAIYLIYIAKNYFILEDNLTYYRQSTLMVSSKFKFLSFSWWKRRMQAHNYIQFFFSKSRINYKKNLDFYLTYIINRFL
tara:strand:- start:2685 stop:3482 length:798 start_codon:yes stop_codon:yes gene_type:complete